MIGSAREEFRPSLGSPESRRECFGGIHGPLFKGQQEIKRLPGQAGCTNDAGLGATGRAKDLFSDVHTINGKDFLHQVKRDIPGLGKENVYDLGMAKTTLPTWPQRERFRALADRWMETHATGSKGQQREALAAHLDLSPQVLKQYYSGTQIPGRERIQKFIRALGCKASDLMDDASTPPAGIDHAEWATTDEDMRAFAGQVFMETKDLSPEQRKALLTLVRSGLHLGKMFQG